MIIFLLAIFLTPSYQHKPPGTTKLEELCDGLSCLRDHRSIIRENENILDHYDQQIADLIHGHTCNLHSLKKAFDCVQFIHERTETKFKYKLKNCSVFFEEFRRTIVNNKLDLLATRDVFMENILFFSNCFEKLNETSVVQFLQFMLHDYGKELLYYVKCKSNHCFNKIKSAFGINNLTSTIIQNSITIKQCAEEKGVNSALAAFRYIKKKCCSFMEVSVCPAVYTSSEIPDFLKTAEYDDILCKFTPKMKDEFICLHNCPAIKDIQKGDQTYQRYNKCSTNKIFDETEENTKPRISSVCRAKRCILREMRNKGFGTISSPTNITSTVIDQLLTKCDVPQDSKSVLSFFLSKSQRRCKFRDYCIKHWCELDHCRSITENVKEDNDQMNSDQQTPEMNEEEGKKLILQRVSQGSFFPSDIEEENINEKQINSIEQSQTVQTDSIDDSFENQDNEIKLSSEIPNTQAFDKGMLSDFEKMPTNPDSRSETTDARRTGYSTQGSLQSKPSDIEDTPDDEQNVLSSNPNKPKVLQDISDGLTDVKSILVQPDETEDNSPPTSEATFEPTLQRSRGVQGFNPNSQRNRFK